MSFLERLPFGATHKARKTEQALEQLREAYNKNDGETLRRFYDEVQHGRARRDFDVVLALEVSKFYGLWLYWEERYAEAELVLRFYVSLPNGVTADRLRCFYYLAQCLLGLNKPEEAERDGIMHLEALTSLTEEPEEALWISTTAANWHYQFARQAELYLEALDSTSQGPKARSKAYSYRFNAALAYANAGQIRNAFEQIQLVGQIADTDEERMYAYEYEGRWANSLGNTELAKTRLEETVRLADDDPERQERALTALAAFMLDQGSFAEMEPLQKLSRKSYSTYGTITNYRLLQGQYELARKAHKSVRKLAPPEVWEKQRHLALCSFMDVAIETEAHYFRKTADLGSARRLIDQAKEVLYRDIPNYMMLIGYEAVLAAIANDEAYATKLVRQVETRLADFDQNPSLQSSLRSLISETYTHLKQYELARDWGEQYLEFETRLVYRTIAEERLANIYEALDDLSKAETLRLAVVESGFPIVAVQAAQEKLDAG